MMENKNKLNVLLIGENIETRIVFKNAISKLDRFCHIDDYYCLDKAVTNLDLSQAARPDIIFLDTNNSAQDCSIEVRKIKEAEKFRDCSLVVYDSNSHLRDTTMIFSEGANAFINKPYDFFRLKKIIANFVNMGLAFDAKGDEALCHF
ncbi:hypothetical protein [Flavobacterium sp.]|uniref:hypothetical protein n=1 Tax=Flavobacterium sp. TaxID=239 RepID=UPI002FD9B2AC